MDMVTTQSQVKQALDEAALHKRQFEVLNDLPVAHKDLIMPDLFPSGTNDNDIRSAQNDMPGEFEPLADTNTYNALPFSQNNVPDNNDGNGLVRLQPSKRPAQLRIS